MMLSLVGDLARLARAGFMMAREGVLAFVPVSGLPLPARLAVRMARLIERRGIGADARSTRLAAGFTACGPNWIKLGQFLATRPDVVGIHVARDLEALLDRVPPFGMARARQEIEAALGKPVDEIFSSLSEPVAAASIAQVHKGVLRASGRTVAVKVLRPGIKDRFQRDLAAYYTGARIIEALLPATRRLKPVGVVDTLAQSAALEMDLRLEAAAMSEMAENTKNDEAFRLPQVEWDYTARTVMTTEWIDAIPLSDLAAVQASNHDLKKLGASVIQHFLRHALRDGFFHADMHQGNLFVDAAGNLVAVDCGIMGRLKPKERRFLAQILWGFIQRDYMLVSQVHFDAGYIPAHQSVEVFAQALRAVGEPMHQKTADEISMARLLTQLFEYTEVFEMQTRLELVFLQKTMVVVEGVGRNLDPKLDMWKVAEPVISEWVSINLGPKGQAKAAATALGHAARLLAEAPDVLQKAGQALGSLADAGTKGLQLSDESMRTIARGLRSPARTAALWAIALALGVIAVRLGLR